MRIIGYNGEVEKTVMTLCIIRHEGRILLGRSKRGIGMGKVNGFGGHVEKTEKK